MCCPGSLLECRAEILVIFGWHFGRNDDLIDDLLDEIIIFFFSGDPAKICGRSQRSREIRSENQRDGIQFGRKQEKSGSNDRIG